MNLKPPISGLLDDKHLVGLLVLCDGATLPCGCNLKMAGIFMLYPPVPMELVYSFLSMNAG